MTTLILPDEPHAAELLEEMDARFFQIVDTLPHPLKELAKVSGTYDGSESSAPFQGLSSMNPGLTCTPWMFWTITRGVDRHHFIELALGGGLVILASILLDHLVDHQVKRVGEIALLHSELQGRGVKLIRGAIKPEDEVGAHVGRLLEEHRSGLAQEIHWRREPDLLTEARFVETVSAKFAPIALTMVAFLVAADRRNLIEPIERSIKNLAVASQLLDDLGDWEEDLRQHRLTLFIKSLSPKANWAGDDWPSANELQERIDRGWADINLLNEVGEWLDRSSAAVAEIDCPAWMSYLKGFRDLADRHLEGRTARHLAQSIQELVND